MKTEFLYVSSVCRHNHDSKNEGSLTEEKLMPVSTNQNILEKCVLDSYC